MFKLKITTSNGDNDVLSNVKRLSSEVLNDINYLKIIHANGDVRFFPQNDLKEVFILKT